MIDNTSDIKRRISSITQRILLLDANIDEDNKEIKCSILGATNKMYTITIQYANDCIVKYCNCPDYTRRKKTCKHLYWLGYKKLVSDGVINDYNLQPEDWTIELLQKFILKCNSTSLCIGRNEICPICFEGIKYSEESTVCCEKTCHNSVHSICWRRYYHSSGNTKCVVCRSQGMPKTIFDAII